MRYALITGSFIVYLMPAVYPACFLINVFRPLVTPSTSLLYGARTLERQIIYRTWTILPKGEWIACIRICPCVAVSRFLFHSCFPFCLFSVVIPPSFFPCIHNSMMRTFTYVLTLYALWLVLHGKVALLFLFFCNWYLCLAACNRIARLSREHRSHTCGAGCRLVEVSV